MSQRYSLRFETTERRGETIPITGTRFTIGRRPGNSLQILENSVSGKHAELLVEASGVLLRDLGSTNGTRVGPEKVLEKSLRPNDEVHIGNVGLRFIDADATPISLPVEPELEDVQVPRAEGSDFLAGSTIVQDLPEDLHLTSERKIERAKKSSRLPFLIVVAVLLLAGGAGWYLTQGGGSGGGGRRVLEVVAVPGNLLADGYSFEGENSSWESAEGATSSFFRNARSAHSGEEGLLADLIEEEWALHHSPEVRAGSGRDLTLTAMVRGDGDLESRIGVLFTSSREADGPEPIHAWQALEPSGTFEEVEVTFPVPVGYDRARAAVYAGSRGDGGSLEVDDVALVDSAGDGPTVTFDEYKVYAFGEPRLSAVLAKVDQPLVSAQLARDESGARLGMRSEAATKGLRVEVEGGAGAELVLHVESAAMEQGLATMGEGGYASHSVDFEREAVGSVLIGGGFDLVRVAFDQPVSLRGTKDERGDFRLIARLAAPGLLLQVRFQEERAAAGDLAAAAKAAERDGQLGRCLELWGQLLEEYPFDEGNTAQAEETRGRLIRVGLDELRAVEQEVERARFFRLVDLFRQCHARALELEERYSPAELSERAAELRTGIDADLAELEADLDRFEVQRLRSILTVLEATESETLAGIVGGYIEEEFDAVDETAGEGGQR